jgi:hypothetical protein
VAEPPAGFTKHCRQVYTLSQKNVYKKLHRPDRYDEKMRIRDLDLAVVASPNGHRDPKTAAVVEPKRSAIISAKRGGK